MVHQAVTGKPSGLAQRSPTLLLGTAEGLQAGLCWETCILATRSRWCDAPVSRSHRSSLGITEMSNLDQITKQG